MANNCSNSLVMVNGKSFRCNCGCNVFHKGDIEGIWICNACYTEYADETYEEKKYKTSLKKTCDTCVYKGRNTSTYPCVRCVKNTAFIKDFYERKD